MSRINRIRRTLNRIIIACAVGMAIGSILKILAGSEAFVATEDLLLFNSFVTAFTLSVVLITTPKTEERP